MSCIIKFPNKFSKGIISINNFEFKHIKNNLSLVNGLKKKWIFLYHPNYYDYNFVSNKIFDGYLAWTDIFKVLDDDNSKILDLSCHNFAPNYFKISNEKKIYDFVGLSKLQTSKGNPKNVLEFLKVVKSTMKIKKDLSGVFIISVPGIRPFKTNYIRSVYDNIFSDEEKKRFEFITLDYDVPFSMSVKTLSIFYNKSKVHLNTHPKERHGRAQAYALSSGLPIVGLSNLTYLVSKEFRKEPYYFAANELVDLPKKLVKAIEYVDKDYNSIRHSKLSNKFRSPESFNELKNKMMKIYRVDDNDWNFNDDWDIRLAKSHAGFKSKNSYYQNIIEFLSKIDSLDKLSFVNEENHDDNFYCKLNLLQKVKRKLRYYVKYLILELVNLLKKIKYHLN